MTKTVIIDTAVAKKIVSELEQLEQLKMQILRLLPEEVLSYGSRLWWEKEELMADEDIKKGRVKKLTSLDELDKPIKQLFP